MDVLEMKWTGSLHYWEVDLVDCVLPSFPFWNKGANCGG